MAQWKQKSIGDIPYYTSESLAWLPGIIQGFTTRHGGISRPPYDTLNLATHVGDADEHVRANRDRVLTDLGFTVKDTAYAEQIHGSGVAVVTEGSPTPTPGVDALITSKPDLLLMLFFADCVPVYLVDPVRRAIGLVHAGRRGILADVVPNTIRSMSENFDCAPRSCMAAIGPCIAGESYIVDGDIADQFRNFPGGMDTGASLTVMPLDDIHGKYTLNLRQIVFLQLLAAGLKPEYISVCDTDTYKNKRDFFSYRRDGATTGRMAGFLALRSAS